MRGCRAAIQRSQASRTTLSQEFGINPKTVAKWRKRATVEDLKTGPKAPHSTTLSEADEAMVVAFRRHTLLPLRLAAVDPAVDALSAASLPAAAWYLPPAGYRGRQGSPERSRRAEAPALQARPQARSILARWVDDDNTKRSHSSLGYVTPAAFAAGLEQQDSCATTPVGLWLPLDEGPGSRQRLSVPCGCLLPGAERRNPPSAVASGVMYVCVVAGMVAGTGFEPVTFRL